MKDYGHYLQFLQLYEDKNCTNPTQI